MYKKTSIICSMIAMNMIFALFGVQLTEASETIYSNFPPYYSNAYNPVQGPLASGGQSEYAGQFMPTGNDYFLDYIDIPLENISGSSSVDVYLASNNGGVPGSILESSSVTAPGSVSVITASFSGSTILSQDVPYWVWLSSSSDGVNGWFIQASGVTESRASRFGGGSWNSFSHNEAGAFKVAGTVVPEPISSTLFIVGGATLGLRRFWKKRSA